jgi:hypothetical protein
MRRLIASFALFGLLTGLSCKTRKPKPEVLVDDTQAQLGSIVAANNPQTAAQLLRGFYDLENGAWRWTMPKFAISFRPPVGAKEKGAQLKADLVLPEVIFSKTGPIEITVSCNGKAIGKQKFTQAGDAKLSLAVPGELLATEAISLEFALDKWLPPSGVDPRDLGMIFSSAGLSLP